MAPRKFATNVIVSEEFRVQSEATLRRFIQDENQNVYEFPSTLSNIERAWLHTYAKTMGLVTKSHGKEPQRVLTVSKRIKDRTNTNVVPFTMCNENLLMATDFMSRYPVYKEKSEQNSRSNRSEIAESSMGVNCPGIPQMPTLSINNELLNFRMSLPIWPMREELMETIVSNQVTIICGETGSGKTTQIPQFILDYTRSCKEKCRIICTQPRRISAMAVAERVSTERAEKIGQTVGFHIRLESCVGPKTVLIYCTNGILLRTLMNGDACLNTYTHVIVDEIHERDRFSDFLLICLRECLVRYPHLRLILMSATMDVKTFQNYFNNAPVIHVPGRLHPVKEYYLEDILKMTNYESPAMANLKKKEKNNSPATPAVMRPNQLQTQGEGRACDGGGAGGVGVVMDGELELDMLECLEQCVLEGTEDTFAQLLQLILSEHVPIDYQHPDTGLTPLMVAAMHGHTHTCNELLKYGASVSLWSKESYTAYDWACLKQHIDVAELLKNCEKVLTSSEIENQGNSDDVKEHLGLYHRTVSDQNIDFDLLHTLLFYIHRSSDISSSILVFLTGYDDIVTVRDRILADLQFTSVPYEIFTLHGHMQTCEQHKVFNTLKGRRKIILSTNIAETSITIDDVVYVIDSGKVKEKCYDAMVGVCSLQSAWVSGACARQRAGRAGRTQPGCCFHMFTRLRHHSMQPYPTPEILRMPLHELCLQTKMLAPKETRIAEFLARALEPPSGVAVRQATEQLEQLGALDQAEQLTALGSHLVELPVEPRLAKMLIYACIFKCLDPVLTIVAFLSYRDPFILPNVPHQKANAVNLRKQFSANTFSDHMILIRAFQAWQDARISKSERTFCNKYFVSSATMDMTVNIRSQLLAQLRACGFVKTKAPGDIRELNDNSNNWPVVKAVLASGLYPNVAFINKSMQIKNKKEKKIQLHMSSSLRKTERGMASANEHSQSLKNVPSKWLVYEEMSRVGNNYNIRSVTNISPLTVALFVDNSIGNTEVDFECNHETAMTTITLNDWILFEGQADIMNLVMGLRVKLNLMITKRISSPPKLPTSHDDVLLQTLAALLAKEDNVLGLVQPPGIGQRPKIMVSNTYPGDNALNYYQKCHPNKKVDKIVTEILHFKPVGNCHYNKYVPKSRKISSSSSLVSSSQPNLVNPSLTLNQPNPTNSLNSNSYNLRTTDPNSVSQLDPTCSSKLNALAQNFNSSIQPPNTNFLTARNNSTRPNFNPLMQPDPMPNLTPVNSIDSSSYIRGNTISRNNSTNLSNIVSENRPPSRSNPGPRSAEVFNNWNPTNDYRGCPMTNNFSVYSDDMNRLTQNMEQMNMQTWGCDDQGPYYESFEVNFSSDNSLQSPTVNYLDTDFEDNGVIIEIDCAGAVDYRRSLPINTQNSNALLRAISAQPRTSNAAFQTNNTQNNTMLQAFNALPQAIIAQTHNEQTQNINAQPQDSNAMLYCNNAQPPKGNIMLQAINALPQAMIAQPENSSTLQDFNALPQDGNTQAQNSTMLQAFNAFPQVSSAQPLANAQPQSSNAMLQAINALPQVMNAQTQVTNAQTQVANVQPQLQKTPWAGQYINPEHSSFYIIKTGTMKSVDVSISKKTWIFSPQTERKLMKVLQTGRIVILIFTVHGSGCLQGIARLLSGPGNDTGHYNLACPVDWLSRTDIPLEHVRHLLNPICSDGQEIEAWVGQELWVMFTTVAPKSPPQLEPTGPSPTGRPIRGTRK